jgi:hypothetical protein
MWSGKSRPLFLSKQKLKRMFSLKCSYYTKQFSSINELVNDVITSGMDPNYLITFDGESIGEEVIDYIQF